MMASPWQPIVHAAKAMACLHAHCQGKCLEAMKSLGHEEWKLGIWEGHFRVLQFEISLRREEDEDD